ncbi:MAG: PAS domain S-box protein, partial [Opitutaceae bacterium]
MGLSAPPTDLHVLPDGRILAVSQREISFGDGVRWEVFRAADGQGPIVSLVAVDTDGQIYAGIEGGIGRLELDADARWRLIKVTDLPGGENLRRTTLVSVAAAGGRWLWYGTGGIVIWRPGETGIALSTVPSVDRVFGQGENLFFSDVAVRGTIYGVAADGAVRQITSGSTLLPDGVTAAVAFGPDEMLVGSARGNLRLFNGTSFRPFGPELFATSRITDLCATAGGYFAAALDGIGIVFFDREGRTVQVLDRSLDHRLARVRRIVAGNDGVIWAILNDGVVRVEFPSPLSSFDPLLASGLTYAKPVRHKGRLWVLTDGRVMRSVYSAAGRLERFEDETPPGQFLFTLVEVEGELFASNETGLFVREPTGWKMALPGAINARVANAPAGPRGWPYFARGEVGFLRRTPDGIAVQRFPAPELDENYNAVADADGVVWLELGTARAARFDPRLEVPTLQYFGPADGFTQGWVEAYIIDGIARIHLPGHLWRYDEATKKLVSDNELIARFPMLLNADGRPIVDPLGRLWHTIAGTARMLERNAAGAYVERKLPVTFGPLEYTVQDDGVVWMFANKRFGRLDLRISPPPASPLRALITSVQYSASNRHVFRPGETLAPLAYADHSLVVRFAAPANPFAAPVTFEVLLEGAGTQWVTTGTVGSAGFNRLKEGSYTFRVRPVAGTGAPGEEARLSFTIRPPWFRTQLAWFVYVVAAGGVLAFAAWFSSFLQRRETERLERLVTKRTEELATTNSQLSRQMTETTEKSIALSASEERYRTLNADLEQRVAQRTGELSLSNAELQNRESLFRLIFERAPVGISWKRADLGDAYHLNATFRRILDLPSGTLPGHSPLASMVHPDDVARHTELTALIQSGREDSYNVEQRFVLKDGRLVWGLLAVAVIRDDRGHVIQDIGILEDITARKHAEEELAKTHRNLVDASRMAGMAEVATGVLHNVGNVLNSLNVSSNTIKTKVSRSKVDGLVKLAALVNDHAANLGVFLTEDPRGRLVPQYLTGLAEHSVGERNWLLEEITSMQK